VYRIIYFAQSPGGRMGAPVVRRVRIFIDFWNFQLSWNQRAADKKCDWTALPRTGLAAAAACLASVGQHGSLDLEETLLYASVDPEADAGLKGWLTNFLDRQPSWRVSVSERRRQPRSLYCRHCRAKTECCPQCQKPYFGKPEKGVDAAIVTDLLSLAWQDAFDIAILITSDADFVPAVERVQEKGLKVINGGWAGRGHHLKTACWAHFEFDGLMAGMCR
jgi:uncharacterized LabA/DUF88 family protein